MGSKATGKEVTFITPEGTMMIRMLSHTSNAICEAAVSLKASHFVTQDGFDADKDVPIIGVFAMSRADKLVNEWVLPEPLRTFPDANAAVMYAMHMRGSL